MQTVHKPRAKEVAPGSKSTVHLVLYMLSQTLPTSIFSSCKKNLLLSVLALEVDFCVFLGPCSGRVACCIMSGHRRPPGGNKSSTCNSEESRLASVSPSIRSGLSVSPPTKMEEVKISPAKDCLFITVIIPKPRFGRNLPGCRTMITFHITKETNQMKRKNSLFQLSTSIKAYLLISGEWNIKKV